MDNTELLQALENLYAVLDTKTENGLSVNQKLPQEIFDLFYGPAMAARIAIAKFKI